MENSINPARPGKSEFADPCDCQGNEKKRPAEAERLIELEVYLA